MPGGQPKQVIGVNPTDRPTGVKPWLIGKEICTISMIIRMWTPIAQ